MGDPREKPPDHPQAELDLSHMWLELGSNAQQSDDEWLRALKISIPNHLAMGATMEIGLASWVPREAENETRDP